MRKTIQRIIEEIHKNEMFFSPVQVQIIEKLINNAVEEREAELKKQFNLQEAEREEWRDIEGFKGYQVSNLGNVRSNKRGNGWMNLRLHYSKHVGYYSISLSNGSRSNVKRFMVHQLVAMAFVPNPDNKPIVHHIDGSRTNNRADNLEWVTASENTMASLAIRGWVPEK